jgi:glycine cleavage system H protein
MSAIKYAKSHEWVRDDGDGTVTVGISFHAQDALGDVVFVELPEVGAEVAAGDTFGVVESVKAASDLYAPVSGTVREVNSALLESPETINASPLDAGWLIKLEPSDRSELNALLDEQAYQAMLEAEG